MHLKQYVMGVGMVSMVAACAAGGGTDSSAPDAAAATATTEKLGHHSKRLNNTTTPVDAGSASSDASTTTTPDSGTTQNSPDAATTSKGQSLVWLWFDYVNSLAAIAANSSSFTHISPAFYQINYSYTSGVPQWWGTTTDNFDGLTSSQIVTKVHALGMKIVPMIFGGAANTGTDQGIQNILNDSPSGTQNNFINALVNEGVSKGYDGWNLDWEVSNSQTTYTLYGKKLESFLGALQSALHAHNMVLQLDVGTWLVKQTWCSGGDGVIDLTTIGNYVDQAIVEAYDPTFGTPLSSCPTTLPNPQSCTMDFMSEVNLMCTYISDPTKISIGLNANPTQGSNPIAGKDFQQLATYKITNVAVWPDYNADGQGGSYLFMDSKGIQPTTTDWYQLLSAFLQ